MSESVMAHLFFGFYFDQDQPYPWEHQDFESWKQVNAFDLGIDIGMHGRWDEDNPTNFAYIQQSKKDAWLHPGVAKTVMTEKELRDWVGRMVRFAARIGIELDVNTSDESPEPYKLDWFFAASSA